MILTFSASQDHGSRDSDTYCNDPSEYQYTEKTIPAWMAIDQNAKYIKM